MKRNRPCQNVVFLFSCTVRRALVYIRSSRFVSILLLLLLLLLSLLLLLLMENYFLCALDLQLKCSEMCRGKVQRVNVFRIIDKGRNPKRVVFRSHSDVPVQIPTLTALLVSQRERKSWSRHAPFKTTLFFANSSTKMHQALCMHPVMRKYLQPSWKHLNLHVADRN